jgi:hypothetical protein
MKYLITLPSLCSLIVAMAVPALAGVTVNSPANGAEVGTTFTLSATSSSCSSQNVSAMGYSLDNSSDTAVVNSSTVQASVQSSIGSHTLHVKSWGEKGAACVTDISINITGSTAGGALSSLGPDAVSVSSIQSLGDWREVADSATGSGSAHGSMSVVNSPSRTGYTRKFVTSASGYGGERYEVSFGDDNTSTNFLYDAWVYLPSPSSAIANLELDMNQTMQNGQTAIFGFQCDGWTSTWDYTTNAGTPEKPVDKWLHSKAYCNPRGWSTDTWHHVQVSYSRDDSGDVTYKSVWLDGLEEPINATVPSAFALGWGPTLLTNVQVDSAWSGGSTSTVFVDALTVYRW